MSNIELAEQLYRPIIIKLENRKPHSSFIYSADLAFMQLISKFNKGILILLYVIDIFSKYAWVIPLKDKKALLLRTLSKKSYINLVRNQT